MSVDYTTPGFVPPISDAEQFFYEHAGYSYDPKRETSEQGRVRCARDLQAAEARADREGWACHWHRDYETTGGGGPLWVAVLYEYGSSPERDISLASLAGIDLGADGRPEIDPYARVVAAELASEAIAEIAAEQANYRAKCAMVLASARPAR